MWCRGTNDLSWMAKLWGKSVESFVYCLSPCLKNKMSSFFICLFQKGEQGSCWLQRPWQCSLFIYGAHLALHRLHVSPVSQCCDSWAHSAPEWWCPATRHCLPGQPAASHCLARAAECRLCSTAGLTTLGPAPAPAHTTHKLINLQ